MNTKQIIDEMEKEFEDVAYHEVVYGNPVGTEEGFKDCIAFIHSYTRKLIESVAEEIIGQKETWPGKVQVTQKRIMEVGRNLLRDEQRLKVKEIINSLEK